MLNISVVESWYRTSISVPFANPINNEKKIWCRAYYVKMKTFTFWNMMIKRCMTQDLLFYLQYLLRTPFRISFYNFNFPDWFKNESLLPCSENDMNCRGLPKLLGLRFRLAIAARNAWEALLDFGPRNVQCSRSFRFTFLLFCYNFIYC